MTLGQFFLSCFPFFIMEIATAKTVTDVIAASTPACRSARPSSSGRRTEQASWPSGKSSRFQRDKFTGFFFAPFFDSLTDSRHHITMRGCRYTAPPLTSTGSVVCWSYRRSIALQSEQKKQKPIRLNWFLPAAHWVEIGPAPAQ